MNNPIRIFIVDSIRLLRDGLVSLLKEQKDLTVIGAEARDSSALSKIKELRPDVVLMDIGSPGEDDGISMLRTLSQEALGVKIIVIGVLDLIDVIMPCIEAGAAGYVLKEATFDHLVETIRAVYKGESFCSPQIAASLFSRVTELTSAYFSNVPQRSVNLTGRELEIIDEIAQGLSNKEIAKRLGIETQTVKNHIHIF